MVRNGHVSEAGDQLGQPPRSPRAGAWSTVLKVGSPGPSGLTAGGWEGGSLVNALSLPCVLVWVAFIPGAGHRNVAVPQSRSRH